MSGWRRSTRSSPLSPALIRRSKWRPLRSIRSCTRATTGSSMTCGCASNMKCPSSSPAYGHPPKWSPRCTATVDIVLHDVINLRHAEKAAAQGVDGIIAVCAGAGGHAGLLSPFALVKQIREVYPGNDRAIGCDEHGSRRVRRASAWRRSGVFRHSVHRDGRRPMRARSTSRCSSTVTCRGHRLYLIVQRHPRQLPSRQCRQNTGFEPR